MIVTDRESWAPRRTVHAVKADEAGLDEREGLVNVGPAFLGDVQAVCAVGPTMVTLTHIATTAEHVTYINAASGNPRLDPELDITDAAREHSRPCQGSIEAQRSLQRNDRSTPDQEPAIQIILF
jgi:hypothetical protein